MSDAHYLIVTGSRGFIGMNFIEKFLEKYKDNPPKDVLGIILVDAGFLKGGQYWEWMAKGNYYLYTEMESFCIKNCLKFIDVSCDINSHEMNTKYQLSRLLGTDNFKTKVVNFASLSHVDESLSSPHFVFNNNTNLISNLINWVGIENIIDFIHIRTDEEFGQITKEESHNIHNMSGFHSDDKLQPRNPYSASKSAQTVFLRSLSQSFNLNVRFVVLANQFGKYQHESKFIPSIINCVSNDEDVKIYGDGENLREWTFVETTCEEILRFTFDDIETLNLNVANCNGMLSNQDLVSLIHTIMDKEIKYDKVEDRLGHDFAYKLMVDNEMEHLFNSLEDDLKTTIEFYKNICVETTLVV